jgi:hypothetical protein
MIGGELTSNPSSSGPTRFRLPSRFFWWVPELTGTSASIYLPQKKAKMILEARHAIAFPFVTGAELTCPPARLHSQHFFQALKSR